MGEKLRVLKLLINGALVNVQRSLMVVLWQDLHLIVLWSLLDLWYNLVSFLFYSLLLRLILFGSWKCFRHNY